MLKVGIVGCGAIGSALARAIDGDIPQAELVAVFDRDGQKAARLVSSLKKAPKILSTNELIKVSDLVVEAASKDIAATLARRVVENGKDCMVMSTGGMISEVDIFNLARARGCKVYLPSGALVGIDGVKSASCGKIYSVTLITSKSPKALDGAPYILKKHIDLDSISKETVIFEGSAAEAVAGFPANINVAATLSLASFGPKRVKVRIVVDPHLKNNNVHEIRVEGKFGRLFARTESLFSPDNPRTSYLAVLSAIATLKDICSSVKIGT
jgi:aspartate dehydrogenase